MINLSHNLPQFVVWGMILRGPATVRQVRYNTFEKLIKYKSVDLWLIFIEVV